MCGIFAILLAQKDSHANQLIFDALTLLQHRGQDAAGMATFENNRVHSHKENGMVKDVFTQSHMEALRGNMGVGHCRYPTAGTSSSAEAQPLYTSYPLGLSCAHNGTLTNVAELQEHCRDASRHFNTNSDSELLLNVLAEDLAEIMPRRGRLTADHVFEAIKRMLRQTRGGYAVALMINGVGIVVFRDIHGIRPLTVGSRPSPTQPGCTDYVASSESVAIDAIGFKLEGDVAPGEAIFFDWRDGSKTSRQCYYTDGEEPKLSPCIFEHVYFARPDSCMDGVSVYEARVKMGVTLARKIKREKPNWDCIDAIIPIPDSARTTAIEVASCLGRPYKEGFQKNRYIARTFIMPGQNARKKTVRLKLSTVGCEFRGKNVLLVDDSIVRGTTSKEIVEMAKEAGAKHVFFASAAPPVRFPNLYGIDLPTREELIASDKDEEQVAECIGADWLVYQDLPDLVDSVQSLNPKALQFGFDASVFDGKYVTGDISDVWDKRVAMVKEEKLSSMSRVPSLETFECRDHEMMGPLCADVEFSMVIRGLDDEPPTVDDANAKRYDRRGVSAAKGDVHSAIKDLDKGLFPKAFCKVVSDFEDPKKAIVMHADGAGTKSSLAYMYWKRTGDLSVWRGIAQDSIVMNLDDVMCVGVTQDIYLSNTIGRNKNLIPKEVIGAIINGSQEFVDSMRKHGVNMVLTGGETADVGDLVRTIIVDSTVTAKIPKTDIVDLARISIGDVIVGFSSSGQATYESTYNSGIGSNGLTSARHDVFTKALAQEFPESFDPSMPEDLVFCGPTGLEDLVDAGEAAGTLTAGKFVLSPTRTYAPIVHKILSSGFRQRIHGMIHCSGGGQAKVLNFVEKAHVVKDNLLPTPMVFKFIQKNSDTPWEEMFKVFNMGHRLEIYTDRESAQHMIDIAKGFGVDAQIIGRVDPPKDGEKKATLTIQSEHGVFMY